MNDIVKVPYRITIAPSGGDNKEWCSIKEGNSYCLTIDKYVYTLVTESPIQEYKLCYSKTENIIDREDIQHRILYNIFNHKYFRDKYYSLLTWSDLPGRSGIGSSAAFTLSVLKALGCKKKGIDLGLAAYKIENDNNIGPQDSIAISCGGLTHCIYKYNETKRWNIKVLKENINNEWYYYLYAPILTDRGRLASNILEKIKDDFYWRRECEYLGQVAFDFYLCNDYDNYKKYINEYTLRCKEQKLIPELDWRRIRRLLYKYAIKKIGAGGKGFYLIISDKVIQIESKNILEVKGIEYDTN